MTAVLVLLFGALYFVLRLPVLRRLVGGAGALLRDRYELVGAGVLIAAVPLLALVGLVDPVGPSRWVSACAVVGVGLLLTSPANDVVAALLSLVRGQDSASQDGQEGGARAAAGLLGGGKWIGSLERLLMVLLALSSASAGIAAVVAAKGVIRFPEISADTPDPKDVGAQGEPGRLGAKAEEFLIGSFSSWLLALLGYLLLRSVGVGQ